MSRMKKEAPRKNPSRDPLPAKEQAVSATECTGLFPVPAQCPEESAEIAALEGLEPLPVSPEEKEQKK